MACPEIAEYRTGVARLCKLSGRLSHCLYRPHRASLWVPAGYAWTRYPDSSYHLWGIHSASSSIAVASFVSKLFDEPVRAWLTNRYSIEQSTSKVASSDQSQRAIIC